MIADHWSNLESKINELAELGFIVIKITELIGNHKPLHIVFMEKK